MPRISGLPVAANVGGADLVVIVQANITKRATVAQLVANGNIDHNVGNLTVNGVLTVIGNSNLAANANVGGLLTVIGNANLSANATVGNNLIVGGNQNIGGNANVTGTLTAAGNANLAANANVGGILTVLGNANLSANANVGGNLTVAGWLAVGVKMSAAYIYSSWNPSDVVGTYTNAPNTASSSYADANYFSFSNSSGTLTITFVKAGSYIINITGAMGTVSAYTVCSMDCAMGGTATRYAALPSSNVLASFPPSQDGVSTRSVGIVATAGQTLTILPRGRAVSVGATTDFSFFASVNCSYTGG